MVVYASCSRQENNMTRTTKTADTVDIHQIVAKINEEMELETRRIDSLADSRPLGELCARCQSAC